MAISAVQSEVADLRMELNALREIVNGKTSAKEHVPVIKVE